MANLWIVNDLIYSHI